MEAEHQKIQVLTHQNQRLAVQLEEKRRDTRILEEKVAKFEDKESEYAQTLLSVNRLWEQLQNDIQHLCADACAQVGGDVKKENTVDKQKPLDPFLARLLQGKCPAAVTKSVTDGKRQLDANHSSVEEALVERATATQEALAHVLECIKQLHSQRMALSQQLSDQSNDAALKQEQQRLSQECTVLQQQVDHTYAAHRTTMEQLQLAEDRQLEAEERIKKLENELADTEQQLSSTQRKYAALKEGQGGDNSLCQAKESGTPHAGFTPSWALPTQDDVAEDLNQLRMLLDKRVQELEKEKENHLKAKRDLQEASSKLGDELWVPSTRTHQQMAQELQRATELVAAKTRELEGVARERDEAIREATVKNHYFHAEAVARQKIAAMEKAYREVQLAKLEGDRMRQELELQLHREREKAGNSKTVPELKTMIVTLQAQVTSLQQHLKLNMVTTERLSSSSQEVLAARGKVEAKENEVQRLADRLRRKDLDLEEQRRREQGLKDRINDLKAFVDVLTVYCNDPRDVAEVRASEAALKEQVAALKGQLEGCGLQQRIKELEAAEQASRDQLDLMALEADSLRVEMSRQRGEAGELETQLQAARSECQLYIAEMETMGTAYEDMQSQNVRLLQRLTERDEAHSQLLAERVKLLQVQQQLQEQRESKSQELERVSKDHTDVLAQKELWRRRWHAWHRSWQWSRSS